MKRQVTLGFLLGPLLLAAIGTPAGGASTATVKQKEPHQVLFAPSGFEKVVLLVSKGKNYKYYQFSAGAPLKIEVEGPTNLELMVRILYDVTMKGVQEYTLRIEEEGLLGKRAEVGVHNLKASKSTVAALKDENKVVPAKAQSLNLAVPGGKHTYYVNLKAGLAKQALLRVLIPAKDLKAPTKGKGKKT